jgi:hypothetical protein
MNLTQVGSKITEILKDNQFTVTIFRNKCTEKWSNEKMFSSVEQEGEFKFILNENQIKIMWRDENLKNWVVESGASRKTQRHF